MEDNETIKGAFAKTMGHLLIDISDLHQARHGGKTLPDDDVVLKNGTQSDMILHLAHNEK